MNPHLKTKCLGHLVGWAAAFFWLLLPTHAASIGLNFSDDWGVDGGAAVTEDAFGVPVANWYNLPRIFNSIEGNGVSSNATITLPEGGSLYVEWSCRNTYSLTAEIPTGPGEDQVIYGYLDDPGSGYRVLLSGFRNFAADYSITLVASTDSGEGFTDAFVAAGGRTNVVQYLDVQVPSYAIGAYSTSTASGTINALTNSNDAVITGSPREVSRRSTLAGILVTYTPGGNNPPLIEVQPQAPSAPVFVGSPFTLTATASGSATLSYQWRLDGTPIENATNPTYRKLLASPEDSGAYDLLVTNSHGAITSAVVNVVISSLAMPEIVRSPLAQSLYAGYPARFSVEATGGELKYQWKKGETTIPDATNSWLVLPNVSNSDQGLYTVLVSNSIGTAPASASLTVLTPRSSYEAAIAASKPIVYFRMSETGSVLQDIATNQGSLGTAGTGLYLGALTHSEPGALVGNSDTAVTLNGGRISVDYHAALNPTGSFTVECWAKPVDTASGNRVLVQSMINGQNADNPNDRSGWVFRQLGANLEFVIGGTTGAPGYTTIVTAQSVVAPENWNHYAAVYHSETLRVSLFVNGVEVTNVIAAEALIPNFAAPLLVGVRGYGDWTFQGGIDEVALYPAGLTPAQLLAHYQAGTNAATSAGYPALIQADGAVEYLRLNEAGLSSADNVALNRGTWGAEWTGTFVGAGSTLGDPSIAKGTVGPRPNTFLGLESDNQAVAMTNGWVTSSQLVLGNHVTTVCWLNRQYISTTGDLSWPAWLGGGGLHLNNGSESNPDAELRYHWNGLKWEWSSGLYVPSDVWLFAALVVEPGQATIYLSDGATLQSAVNPGTHDPMIVMSPPGFGGNQPGRSDRNYIGQIDEAAVYDRALSPEEINALFTASLTAGPVPPSALVLTTVNNEYFLTWTAGVLQQASAISGQFSDVPGATSPYKLVSTAAQNFFGLRAE